MGHLWRCSTACAIKSWITVHCNTLQHTAYITLQQTATHCNALLTSHCNTLQHTATQHTPEWQRRALTAVPTKMKNRVTGLSRRCSAARTIRCWINGSLHHTATYCNILQHTATHCNTACPSAAPSAYRSADKIGESSHGSLVKVQRSLCKKVLGLPLHLRHNASKTCVVREVN